ncbi:hypothetical protein EII12_01640 [Buchananella hordeovulneris]|uniref:hypothetical protein n=1 Tax=Buchananella hordeovulneris TaxID=52770 RepID=UPI000F5F9F1A|nr:hypothetical protein [Buchananella hordeovulneris]RRD53525.1 hypothetical protein EII12_01640 [Buchananella hordeovulneris]
MEVELELARRVAGLQEAELTESDVHAFLLAAAELLGGPPQQLNGPGATFRWYRGARIVEIAAQARYRSPFFSLTVRGCGTEVVDNYEYRAFKNCSPFLLPPYLWAAALGRLPDSTWLGGDVLVGTWEQFADTVGRVLDCLPRDLALTPPAWRQLIRPLAPSGEARLAYLFNMGSDSPWGGVSFTGTPAGVDVYGFGAQGDEVQLLVPRALLDSGSVKMTDVVAGLAGGSNLAGVEFFDVEGFSMCPHPPKPSEPVDDLLVDEFGEPLADTPRAGISLDELRALIAASPASPSLPPRRPRPAPVPLQLGLSFPQALALVDQLLQGVAATTALTAAGAQPGEIWGRPALVGDGWHATVRKTSSRTLGADIDDTRIELCPSLEDGLYDGHDSLRYAWQLADLLTERYGSPLLQETGSSGHLSRLYQVGQRAVQVSTSLGGIELEVADADGMLMLRYC